MLQTIHERQQNYSKAMSWEQGRKPRKRNALLIGDHSRLLCLKEVMLDSWQGKRKEEDQISPPNWPSAFQLYLATQPLKD